MTALYVTDTCCLINYYGSLFGEARTLSRRTVALLDAAISGSTDVLLSIPSLALLEIYDKWLRDEEFAREFYYEVFIRIADNENIEVRSIDREVLDNVLKLDGTMLGHDPHDKIVLASAMVLACPLITFDPAITSYVGSTHVVPRTLR